MAEKFGLLQGKFGADADGNIEFDAVELDKYMEQLEFELDEGGDNDERYSEQGKGTGQGTVGLDHGDGAAPGARPAV